MSQKHADRRLWQRWLLAWDIMAAGDGDEETVSELFTAYDCLRRRGVRFAERFIADMQALRHRCAELAGTGCGDDTNAMQAEQADLLTERTQWQA